MLTVKICVYCAAVGNIQFTLRIIIELCSCLVIAIQDKIAINLANKFFRNVTSSNNIWERHEKSKLHC